MNLVKLGKGVKLPDGATYIGRAVAGYAASPLANPFRVDEFGVDEAIRLCAHHLVTKVIAGDQRVLDAFAGLTAEATLGCWCDSRPAVSVWRLQPGVPLVQPPHSPCHGDLVASVWEALHVEPDLMWRSSRRMLALRAFGLWADAWIRADPGAW